MAVNDFNSLRVDLSDIYKECEDRTSFHSRVYQNNELNQVVVISSDDYYQLHKFAEDAANQISNHSNYITTSTQTGLEAITADFTDEEPNLNDAETLECLDERKKQTGELLVKGPMDTMTFNVSEIEGLDPKRFTIIQGFIRSAILEYILYKWYSMCRINDEANKALGEFEKYKNLTRFNSITNRKRIKKDRLYRAY